MQEKKKFVVPGRPKKRLFLGLILGTTVIWAVVLYALWYIMAPGLAGMASWLPSVVGGVFALLVALVLLGILNIVLAINNLPFLGVFQKQSYQLINALFPWAVRLGKPFGISRRKLEGSFIAVSNVLFNRRHIRVPADRLLVVTPHCRQLATCPRKITRDPHNCQQCGGCDIGALVKMADEMGFHFYVATGGTLARQIVYTTKPQAVLAIACERDLMSGIQDVYPLPAVGVMNIRPNGPCFNTHVDIEAVRRELQSIIIPGTEHNAAGRNEAILGPMKGKDDDD